MSIFGKLWNTKKAIEEQSLTNSLSKSAPYKHVPTHAAIDTLACAPPGWRHMEDRKAIQAQHNRRNEMSRSASGVSVVTSLSRGGSDSTNDWTVTTTDQRSAHRPMPFLPDVETTRRLSPLHTSGNVSATYTCDLY